MKKIITLILAVCAVACTVPQGEAQQAGDLLVPQRTGTTTIGLKPLTGGTYALINSGTATLTSGSVTVANANVTGSSVFLFTGSGTSSAGSLALGTVVTGTSFNIVSTSGSDGRAVFWWFLKK